MMYGQSEDEEFASEHLNSIIDKALKFSGTAERNYLKKLWEGESWQRIKSKLRTEGSVWYVWFMDRVRQHLQNISEEM